MRGRAHEQHVVRGWRAHRAKGHVRIGDRGRHRRGEAHVRKPQVHPAHLRVREHDASSTQVDLLAVDLDELLRGHQRVLAAQAHRLLRDVIDPLGPELLALLDGAVGALHPLRESLQHGVEAPGKDLGLA